MSFQWSCLLGRKGFQPYDPHISQLLENAFQSDYDDASFTLRNTQYTISFRDMKQYQTNDHTKTRPVKREYRKPPQSPGEIKKRHSPQQSPQQSQQNATKRLQSVDLTEPKRPKKAHPTGSPKQEGSPLEEAEDLDGPHWPVSENNSHIQRMLVELAQSERASGEVKIASVYMKAAKAVKEFGSPITNGKRASKEIKGIGPKIAEKIDELLSTGKLKRPTRDGEPESDENCLRDLQRISGIGYQRAKELMDLGMKNVDMLSSIDDLLTQEERIGLKYLADFDALIPRSEVAGIIEVVSNAAKSHDPPLQSMACGDFRRGKDACGDVDILLYQDSYLSLKDPVPESWMSEIVERLKKISLITDVISLGPKICNAVCNIESYSKTLPEKVEVEKLKTGFELPTWQAVEERRKAKQKVATFSLFGTGKADKFAAFAQLPVSGSIEAESLNTYCSSGMKEVENFASTGTHRRLNLKLVPYESLSYASLHFTGPHDLNEKLRLQANDMGLQLNEYNLEKIGDDGQRSGCTLAATCEQDIFDHLNQPYVPPTKR